MKRKIIFISAIVCFAIVVIANIKFTAAKTISDVSLSNVEALAAEESQTKYTITSGSCSITFDVSYGRISGQPYGSETHYVTYKNEIHDLGKSYVGSTYTRTWSSATRKCTTANKGSDSCSGQTCAEFFNGNPSWESGS